MKYQKISLLMTSVVCRIFKILLMLNNIKFDSFSPLSLSNKIRYLK